MEKKIPTALGMISPEELGLTLPHEHLVYNYSGWYNDPEVKYSQKDAIEQCVRKVSQVRDQYGVKTLVDCSPCDVERDIEVCKRVQEQTGVQVISSTGFYTTEFGENYYWRRLSRKDRVTNLLYEKMMQELTIGINGTDVKAGAIKIATSAGQMTDFEAQVFEAAAMAQKETGAPIITHTEAGTLGDVQAKLLTEYGVAPHKILISHMDLTGDIDYVERTISYGVFIGFDSIGVFSLPPDPQVRLKLCTQVFQRGHAKHVMLSSDHICYLKGRWGVSNIFLPKDTTYTLYATFEILMPYLREHGILDSDFRQCQIDNPKVLFS